MADQKALYLQTHGVAKKILAADSVIVGSGVKSDAGQGLTLTAASGDITMANAVAMGTNKITGAGAASAANDVVTYGQASASLAGLTLTGDLAMGTNDITLGAGQTVDGKDVSTLIASVAEASDTDITALAEAEILVVDAAGKLADVAVGGDISIIADGTVSIASNVIVNADINTAAAIAVTKIANGTENYVLVSGGSDPEWANSLTLGGTLSVDGDADVDNLQIDGDLSGTALITDTGLAGAANTNLASALALKTYADNKLTGLEWKNSVDVLGLVGNAAVATINGLSPTAGDAYVVTDAGTITSGSISTAIGDLVEYDGSVWIRIAQGSGGFVPDGIRAVLSTTVALISPYTDATDDGKIAEFDGTSLTGTLTSDTAANAAILVQDSGSISYYDNLGFTFEGSVPTGSWVQFTGAGQLTAGTGLSKSGNTINAGAGNGISVGADTIAVSAGTAGGDVVAVTVTASGVGFDVSTFDGDGLLADGSGTVDVVGGTAGGDVVACTVTASGVGFDVSAIDGNGLAASGSGSLAVTGGTAGADVVACTVTASGVGVDVSSFDGNGLLADGSGSIDVVGGTAGGSVVACTVTASGVGVDADSLDGTGLEVDGSTLRIAAAAAGDGLEGGGGSALSVHLEATNPSLQIATDELGVKIYADGGLQKTSNGMEIKLNGATLALATAGASVAGLPSAFTVNGTATNGTKVTAPNLDTLCDGSNADSLHIHAAAAATETTFAGTADVALTAGQLVSLDNGTNGNVLLADANGTDEKPNAVGFVDADAAQAAAVNVQLNGDVLVPDAYWPSDTAPAATEIGKRVYMSETPGDVTLTAPTALGSVVLRVGYLTAGGTGASKVLIDFGEGVEN